MRKAAKDSASRPYVKKGCLVGAILAWLVAVELYMICFIGIRMDFYYPVFQILSERGLIPAIIFSIIGLILFLKFKDSKPHH